MKADRASFKKPFSSFSTGEKCLWILSSALILVSFFVFGGRNFLTLLASLIGAASLIFNAKGHPLGQLLMVIFSLLYGVISYAAAYYGEMATYLGMTCPMALFSLIVWLKHPYEGNRAEVAIRRLSRTELLLLFPLSAAVTLAFFFLLRALGTSQLPLSTLSVTTSFLAVFLTARRSAFYALAYAANDVVLIALWILAAQTDPSGYPVVVCFSVFLLNDLYGFFNWRKMHRRQSASCTPAES